MSRSESIRRWSGRCLVFFLVGMLATTVNVGARDDGEGPGPLGKPSDGTTYGHILVPTAKMLRSQSPYSGHGVTQYQVSVEPKAQFTLEDTASLESDACLLGFCAATGDFDIVFFQERGNGETTVTGRFTDVGPESGVVPDGSSFGFVYLTTPSGDPGFRGFRFAYWQGEAPAAGNQTAT